MTHKFNINQVRDYIDKSSSTSKVYIGCDSVTRKVANKYVVDFVIAIVVHIDGHRGCKIFGSRVTEVEHAYNKKKPLYRLMREVHKVAEMYMELFDVIGDREVEVHLDINPSEKHVSNLVVQQAVGYIRGACNVEPKIKPNAPAASYAADRLLRRGTYATPSNPFGNDEKQVRLA